MVALVDKPTGTDRLVDASAWWRLWAMAAFAHVVSNGLSLPLAFRSLTNAAVGLLAIAVIVAPSHRTARSLMAVALPVSVFAEAPFVGNHWFVAGAVSLAALIARPWDSDDDWWPRFAPTARIILLTFYSFAAFAKLNSGFIDPVESCSRFFANQMLSFWQLPEIGGGSPIAPVLPWFAIVVELSVPVLLLMRRTRNIGVWLGVTFHLLLTLDLQQHFFDFTLMLIPLFLLFAQPGTLASLDARFPRSRLAGGRPWMAVAAAMVIAATVPAPLWMKGMTVLLSWALWLGLAFLLARKLVVRNPLDLTDDGSPRVDLRPPSIGAAVLVAAIIFNGLSPYLEIKTAAGFNMYANLTTIGGETNHFIVRGTASLRDDQAELATIVATSDEDLAEYIDSGFALPVVNLRDYLADHQDISVSFVIDRERIDLARAGDHQEWIDRQPWYEEKFLLFRAVPDTDPPACQNSFLPAR